LPQQSSLRFVANVTYWLKDFIPRKVFRNFGHPMTHQSRGTNY
jgi:hypothetical protein